MPSFLASGLNDFAAIVGAHPGPEPGGAFLFADGAAEGALGHIATISKSSKKDTVFDCSIYSAPSSGKGRGDLANSFTRIQRREGPSAGGLETASSRICNR